nr:MAG TPA: Lecithin retinol acyltransferase [Caudoviricetes sp.]
MITSFILWHYYKLFQSNCQHFILYYMDKIYLFWRTTD